MSCSDLPPSQAQGAIALRALAIAAKSLGLPAHIRACLFDLDGVLTQTATVHAAAWKEMFDAFLKGRATQTDTPFVACSPATSSYPRARWVTGQARTRSMV
jgi:hypothetical protein